MERNIMHAQLEVQMAVQRGKGELTSGNNDGIKTRISTNRILLKK